MKKRGFIDKVRVQDPCTQAWDEMKGNDKVRFCSHCAKDVNNISALTRKEVIRLVRRSGGSLCVRYVQEPVTKAPILAEQLTQITRRRVPLMAAGVMGASLSLATLTYAQGGAPAPSRVLRDAPAAAQTSECEDNGSHGKKNSESAGRVLRGAVVDQQGAVVPGMMITLRSANEVPVGNSRSDESGSFRFDSLPPGNYVVQTDAGSGFNASRVENIQIGDDDAIVEIPVTVSSESVTMGVVAFGPEYQGRLAIAVADNDIDEARNLIANGEDVNRKEEDGTTPIFVAVDNGNLAMVQLLLDSGAKINTRDKEKRTALMQLDTETPVEMVELLIRYGAKVNPVSKLGNTALILAAAMQSRPEVVKALIDAGAKLDVQNAEGMTALMFAADDDNVENARLLIVAGANVNLKDNDDETAWDKTTDSELESLLESYGAIVDKEEVASEPQPEP